MESLNLQDWTRIGAMNLKTRKLLICSPGVWRFMGSPHSLLRTHWDHEPSQSTCRPATWCRRLVGRAELFLPARCRQHAEVHGENARRSTVLL